MEPGAWPTWVFVVLFVAVVAALVATRGRGHEADDE